MARTGSTLGTGAIPNRDRFRFRATALQVLVPANVTDRDGRPVSGLCLEDFRVWEDGVEQPLQGILTEEAPLSLAIVVDLSGSMRSKMDRTVDALEHLLASLGANDQVLLLGFHEDVVLLHDFTSDFSSLPAVLSAFDPDGGTAMFDGVVEGLYRLYKVGSRTRRALILLSDGFDNESVNTPRETVAAAKATGIPIYTVGLGQNRRGLWSKILGEPIDRELTGLDENRLRALAASTGGLAFILEDLEQKTKSSSRPLRAAFERMATEVRSHYVLSYQAPRSGLDGRWHSLRVELSRPGFSVRFRPGYLAIPLE